MIKDMRLRKLAEKTQSGSLHWVEDFTRFPRRAADTAAAEDLRRCQLHLSEHGTSQISLNAAVTTLPGANLSRYGSATLDHCSRRRRSRAPLSAAAPVVDSGPHSAVLAPAPFQWPTVSSLEAYPAPGADPAELPVSGQLFDPDAVLHHLQRAAAIA